MVPLSGSAASAPARPIIRGRDAVIDMRPLLVEFGYRSGQAGVLDHIHLLVSTPTALRKIPTLVLVGLRSGVRPEEANSNDLHGIVLLYEYTAAGVPTGIYATDDVTGERTVLGPRERRAQIAEQACRILADHGAVVSLVSVEGVAPAPRPTPAGQEPDPSCRVGMRVRTQGRDLLLSDTLDATLATFGRHTRRNFRLYRRRAEADLSSTFVPCVRIQPEEFLELNRSSTNPVSEEEAAWRYHFISSIPNRLFSGVRAADGRWLSLVAGTRHGGEVHVEWQVNRAGLPRYSLSTVMRSYLLEHEIALGTGKLLFRGGTPHSMGLSLSSAEILDIILVKRDLRVWLLRQLSRWGLPRPNFLGRALDDTDLAWVA